MEKKEKKFDKVYKVTIEKIVYEGYGLARLPNGKVVFVPYVLPGEEVVIRLLEDFKDYARAKVIRIKKPSPFRENVGCQHYQVCGGCNLLHTNYEYQLKLKEEIFNDMFKGKKLDEVVGSKYRFGYRNKVQLPVRGSVGDLKIGFFRKKTHDLVPINDCLLHAPILQKAAEIIVNVLNKKSVKPYNEVRHKGVLKFLVLRTTPNQDWLQVVFVVKEYHTTFRKQIAKILEKKLGIKVSIAENKNPDRTNVIFGKITEPVVNGGLIEFDLVGLKWILPPTAFFQVNYDIAEKMALKIRQLINGSKMVWDLYCGIGFLGLSSGAKQIVGVEENESAVAIAKKIAKENNIEARFYVGDATKLVGKLKKKFSTPDAVIFDPPRSGLKKETILVVNEVKPKKIIYASCKLSTFKRDIKLFESLGWKITYLGLYDMFPNTHHFEVLACLEYTN